MEYPIYAAMEPPDRQAVCLSGDQICINEAAIAIWDTVVMMILKKTSSTQWNSLRNIFLAIVQYIVSLKGLDDNYDIAKDEIQWKTMSGEVLHLLLSISCLALDIIRSHVASLAPADNIRNAKSTIAPSPEHNL
ncbi:MAG: hypothetical protein EZS28_006748 [Streblomastix strix]|uniref:Uncharacterized protein n=1 Tax=Streblomastix strix TaxID=222440 RepID=A0A5J4WS59_9EUKA|nr:MAG: hypothetical protein EZS28_006748 [Streblomastix strix]